MEKIVRARVRFVRVLYRIVLSEYTFWTRVSPHPRIDNPPVRSSTSTAPFPARLSKGPGKVISYFRVSLGSNSTRTFVIDGPWRTYRLLTRSQNYSDSMLLCVTNEMKTASRIVCHRKIHLRIWQNNFYSRNRWSTNFLRISLTRIFVLKMFWRRNKSTSNFRRKINTSVTINLNISNILYVENIVFDRYNKE